MAKVTRRKNGDPTEPRLPAYPLQTYVANIGDRTAAERLGVDESRLRHFAQQSTVQRSTVVRWCGRLGIDPAGLYPDFVTDDRPDVETWLFEEAEHAARRSTCPRAHVGAVLVRDGRVISHGYNGAPPGQPHCTEVGCDEGPDGGCRRTAHAEMNAIAFAARFGTRTEGAELWCTHSPCRFCAKLIAAAGIERVVAKRAYRDESGVDLLDELGIRVIVVESLERTAVVGAKFDVNALFDGDTCTICGEAIVREERGSLVCRRGHFTVDPNGPPVEGIDRIVRSKSG